MTRLLDKTSRNDVGKEEHAEYLPGDTLIQTWQDTSEAQHDKEPCPSEEEGKPMA